ncbi:YbaB/EbfC family nucleoid-associated protein [Nonomuraea sp. NPDC005983]|uniref:YbaB/EbfC family nucleoid-associated protein n=1 Tax=Nonomuraea sp. NPDC005983 TaxID=3155595 RepID=UPI0033AC82F4
MKDQPSEQPDFLDRFAAVRETGTAADGLVKVEVDGTSNLVQLKIDPRAMRLSSDELAAAIMAAFGQARFAAQERATDAIPAALQQDSPELDAMLREIRADAQTSMNEILVVANELSMRLDRLMRPSS